MRLIAPPRLARSATAKSSSRRSITRSASVPARPTPTHSENYGTTKRGKQATTHRRELKWGDNHENKHVTTLHGTRRCCIGYACQHLPGVRGSRAAQDRCRRHGLDDLGDRACV